MAPTWRQRRPVLVLAVFVGIFLILGTGVFIYISTSPNPVDLQKSDPAPPQVIITNINDAPVAVVAEELSLGVKTEFLSLINQRPLLLAVAAIIAVIVLIIVVVKATSASTNAVVNPASSDPKIVYDGDSSSFPALAFFSFVAFFFLVYLISQGESGGQGRTFTMAAVKNAFQEDPIEYNKFTEPFGKKIYRMMTSGQTQTDLLTKILKKDSPQLAEIVDEDISQQDLATLMSKYLDILDFDCSDEDGHLEQLGTVSVEHYAEEIPKVTVKHPSSAGSLEIAFAERPSDPIRTFAPKGTNLSHTSISDLHIFIETRGALLVVVKGEKRAALAVAIVASKYCGAHCSISKSGKRIMEKIQSLVELFTLKPDDPLLFTIVQQHKEGSQHYVDVIQAGLLAVAVKSKKLKQISAQTSFAPESMTDVKYYRMTANTGDYVIMYTNTVAYNVFPAVIADIQRATSLTGLVSALFTHATNAIHIPCPAETQPCSPIIPPGGEQILTLSRAI